MSSAVRSMFEDANLRPTVKAFCLGKAKSGTASLYGLLATNHRAAHEPERAQILEMILRQSRGEVDTDTLVEYLIRRDQRLKLEYDIAWANQFLIRHLVVAFPEATFVVLIRDPYPWLQSIVAQSLDARQGHLNRSSWTGRLASMVEGDYLSDMVGKICGANMACYFPEISGIDDVGRLWE